MNIGDIAGNYRITKYIGRGGFANIYFAEHNYIKGKHAAVKVLHATLIEEDRDAFKIEAQRLYDLQHPNIVPITDFAVEPQTGIPFLIMEYAANGSLRSKHSPGKPLPKETILSYVRQVASALQYIHQHGLTHRDIKPANMLLGPNNVVWLSDVGIAVELPSQTLTPRGTPLYMSPEQTRGKPCPASDQYALGVVVYEWLCGERPFNGSNLFDLAFQHEQKPPPSLQGRVPHLPPKVVAAVETVVFIALAKRPEDRFASITAFATAFEQAITETEAMLPSPSPADGQANAHLLAVKDAEVVSLSQLSTSPLVDGQANAHLPAVKDAEVVSLSQLSTSPLVDRQANVNLPSSTKENAEVVSISQLSTAFLINKQTKADSEVPKKTRKKRPIVAVISLILFLALLLSTAAYGIFFYLFSSAYVTITPKTAALDNVYNITGVTSSPNPDQMEIAARELINVPSGSQQKMVSATGVGHDPGKSATGTIIFDQGSGPDQYVPAGAQFTSKSNGLEVVTDGTAHLLSGNSSDTVPAHVVLPGVAGNAVYINQACCNPPQNSIHATSGPFSGGAEPYTGPVVQKSDIDGVVQSLAGPVLQQAPQQLHSQVKPNEALVSSPDCQITSQSNHQAGDETITVTVTVAATCTGETYDRQGAQALATNLLKQDARSRFGESYVLVRSAPPDINSVRVADPTTGRLSLQVSARGEWVYQFSQERKNNLLKLIAGKTKTLATHLLLQQTGVQSAEVQVIHGDGNTLPTDLSRVTITIASPPFSRNSPTPSLTSTTLVAMPKKRFGGYFHLDSIFYSTALNRIFTFPIVAHLATAVSNPK